MADDRGNTEGGRFRVSTPAGSLPGKPAQPGGAGGQKTQESFVKTVSP
jgi:hypothetical protein